MRSPLWFVVAGLIALAGFAGALFYLMPRLGAADSRMIRVVVPGSTVLTLDKAGRYTIYHEKKSTVDGRYQNFAGQLATVCSAGTVVICHHGLWHCGQPNRTNRPRTMFKLRLGPAGAQRRSWDLGDLEDPTIGDILRHEHPWTGSESRLEIVNRIKLWRHLTGDPTFDVDYWLSRMVERG